MIHFVIPSYKRSDCLYSKTFQLLLNLNVAIEHIYIFVVEEELEIYQTTFCNYPTLHIITGPLGLHCMRNYIRSYFPEGSQLIHLDDDIDHLYYMQEDTQITDLKSAKRYPLYPLTSEQFHLYIHTAFSILHQRKIHLFGIYPVKNGYFMKDLPEYSYDLRFCVGVFWGCINQHHPHLQLHLEEKEDFERTLLYYEQDQSILRLNRIVPKTKYYKLPGGMQARPYDRIATSKESCQYLLQRFPQYCKLYTSKKSGIYEVRLQHRLI